MLVRATQRGYYGVVIREPGHIFTLVPRDIVETIEDKDEKGRVISVKKVKRTLSVEDQFADHEIDGGWMERVDSLKAGKNQKGSRKSQPIGNRPAPEDQREIDARIAKTDRMAREAAAEDAENAEDDGVI